MIPRRRDHSQAYMAAGIGAAGLALFGALLFPSESAVDADGVQAQQLKAEAARGGLRMLRPGFSGETDRGEPYAFTAAWALPDGPNPTQVEIGALSGEATLMETGVTTLVAQGGSFNPRERRVALRGDVRVATETGYTIETQEAFIDAAARKLERAAPVLLTGPEGVIRANEMTLDGLTRIVIFNGDVKVLLTPNAQKRDGDPEDAK